MRLERIFSFFLLALVFLAGSCEKAEVPVTLPPKGTADTMRVETGEDYENQVFFDFETGIVAVNKVRSWDLAFEASGNGFHVFMNGDKNIYIYNTGNNNISGFTNTNALDFIDKSKWAYDAACGLPDSTGVGNWRNASGFSKNEVFIVKFDNGLPEDNIYKKFIIDSVSSSKYILRYGDLSSSSLTTIHIPKDPLYNYSYFSFDDGGKVVMTEPPRDSWDIVFTHYRYFYPELNNFPYLVSGVLLNSYNTTAREDSTTAFSALSYSNSISLSDYSNHRDVIGWTWKNYDRTSGRYTVDNKRNFIVKNRKGQYWKMHFLEFYSKAGIKGSPFFEYERMH